ncbi:MAG: UDP-glucose 4-epimerase GalE [Candidatus Babeliales bacterium]
MLPTILITGGAGYIGSHTAYLLAQRGYQVIVLDSFMHNQYFNPQWATVIKEDFADKSVLENIFTSYNIQAVMHFAACIEVGESVKNPHKFYENNIAKSLVLLNSMIEHNIKKFIFSSSCAVYGLPETIPLTEEHSKNPISPYGKTKQMLETILEDFHNAYDLEYINLRYFNAGGALPEEYLGEQHKPETHIIPLLLRAAQNKMPFTIFGYDYDTKDGTAIRDYLHVLDIAQAHICALQHLENGNPSDSFNLGTGNGISVKEMVHTVENITRQKLKLQWEKRRAGDPAILVADANKARTILNWQPHYSDIEFIIKSALAFILTALPTKIITEKNIELI